MIAIDNRNTDDPYINLAVEEYVVRHFDFSAHNYVLLYINRPAVVMGKNQSIYKELNFEVLRKHHLHLCRRISGGGTVYHDAGNISFAFFSAFAEHKVNNYHWFNKPILDTLHQLGIAALPDARNSIFYKGKKISGNAQFTNRKAILSHGTLLFNANMDLLRLALKPNEFKVHSTAPQSVRSPVDNLAAYLPQFATASHFKTYLLSRLNIEHVVAFSDTQWNEIQQLATEKFRSAAWIYGRSPHTTIEKAGCHIVVEQGMVTNLQCGHADIENLLRGCSYTADGLRQALQPLGSAPADDWVQRLF